MPAYLSLCKPLAHVKIIEASLSLVGYAPFTGSSSTRYLRKTESCRCGIRRNCGTQSAGSTPFQVNRYAGYRSASDTLTKTTNLDPFTNLECVTGDYIESCLTGGGCSVTEESATSRTTECADTCPSTCGQSSSGLPKRLIESLSQPYSLDDVSDNVSDLLDGADWDQLPGWGMIGTVIPASDNDHVLSYRSASGERWRAEHRRDGQTVSKTKILVRFLEDTGYTIDENGSLSMHHASKGDTIDINAPDSPGDYIEIHACQALTDCQLAPRTQVDFSSSGYREVRDSKTPGCFPRTGFDCRPYMTWRKTFSQNMIYNSHRNRPGPGIISSTYIHDFTFSLSIEWRFHCGAWTQHSSGAFTLHAQDQQETEDGLTDWYRAQNWSGYLDSNDLTVTLNPQLNAMAQWPEEWDISTNGLVSTDDPPRAPSPPSAFQQTASVFPNKLLGGAWTSSYCGQPSSYPPGTFSWYSGDITDPQGDVYVPMLTTFDGFVFRRTSDYSHSDVYNDDTRNMEFQTEYTEQFADAAEDWLANHDYSDLNEEMSVDLDGPTCSSKTLSAGNTRLTTDKINTAKWNVDVRFPDDQERTVRTWLNYLEATLDNTDVNCPKLRITRRSFMLDERTTQSSFSVDRISTNPIAPETHMTKCLQEFHAVAEVVYDE